MKKKIIAFLVVVALIMTMLPVAALAEGEPVKITTDLGAGSVTNPPEGWTPDEYVDTAYYKVYDANNLPTYAEVISEWDNVTVTPDDSNMVFVKIAVYGNADLDTTISQYGASLRAVYGYTVSFDTNGGSEIAPQKVARNKFATKPETDPTKEGYTFIGWFKDKDLTTIWEFDTEKVNENITIYAGWSKDIKDIYTCKIADIPKQQYTGNAITPAITVTDGEKVLVENTDYTVKFENNVNVGTAQVAVTGINDYDGTTGTQFEIVKATTNESSTSSTPTTSSTPKTGDETNVAMLITIISIAAAAVVIIGFRFRKQH